jgi:hypothetical protein
MTLGSHNRPLHDNSLLNSLLQQLLAADRDWLPNRGLKLIHDPSKLTNRFRPSL